MPAIRAEVVTAVRESLPEFAERNGIELTGEVMDNLAYWVTGVIPSETYRMPCPLADGSCACSGACQVWRRVS